MCLDAVITELKEYEGLKAKGDIQPIAKALKQAHPNPFCNGDDAAVIPMKNDQGFQLMCGEGFLQAFTEFDPWHAGWCSVMVNVSDIAAMGGRPTAMTNTYWGKDDLHCQKLYEGMAAASRAFQVPIVGGHTNLQSDDPHLAVTMFGHANELLSSFAARPDQSIVMAVDLRGEYQKPFLNWNAATKAPPQQLRMDYALLPKVAEQHLATSAKDISQAGTLGTVLMLLESAQLGADIDLEEIPKPEEVALSDWLKTFPSFGFILTCDGSLTPQLIKTFSDRSIACAQIGKTNSSKQLWVKQLEQRGLFWDLQTHPLTGFDQNQITNELSHQEVQYA